jgi:hypothetical protein
MEIVRYLTGVPKAIPEGTVLVHNFRPGSPDRKVRDGGFRIFLATFVDDEERGPACNCGWRGGVEHYESPGHRASNRCSSGVTVLEGQKSDLLALQSATRG